MENVHGSSLDVGMCASTLYLSMKDAEAWKREITEKLQRKVEKGEENMSIYKVPTRLRRVKDEAYNCRVVSIRPFQLENPDLAAMSEHKWHYLQFFLKRVGDDEQSRRILEEFTTSIYDLDAVVRGCYSEKFNHIYKNVLAEIMLLDGCFILELLLRYEQHFNKNNNHSLSIVIFNSAWMIAAFQHDLALLENEIPFFILKLLYDAIKIPLRGHPPKSVTNLALSFFQPTNHKAIEKTLDPTKDYKHFLDLLHKFYLPSRNPVLVNSPSLHQVSVDLTPQNQHIPMVQPNASARVNPKAGAKRIKACGLNFTATKLLGVGLSSKCYKNKMV
ncbi:UPF0481 protein At3g47200-like [Argentina anserina]|uniref:UPF0481 protein At3g47200-like n=1 Tax=Argentina anserina TaxID=57926 RepID=UPI00217692D9|nr:UPF0481 protein At3g47200-like [Potentilla anserina]